MFGFLISVILMGCLENLENPVLPHGVDVNLFLLGHVTFTFIGTICFYVALNITSGVLVSFPYISVIVFSAI